MHYLAVALVLLIAGCGGTANNKADADLRATVVALQAQLARTPEPTVAPTAPAAATPTPTPAAHSLTGTLSNSASSFCERIGMSNAAVVVNDGNGAVIATGKTGEDIGHSGTACVVGFTIDVPYSAFYVLTIAGHKTPIYSRADLEGKGWTLDLYVK